MIRMIMHGCGGAMGHTITGLAKDMKEIEIVAGVDLKEEDSLGYPVFSSLEACNVEADVIVDFASAKAVDHLLDYCGEQWIRFWIIAWIRNFRLCFARQDFLRNSCGK